MSSIALQIPQEYGYVILSGALTVLVGFWHGARVGPFRKRAGVPYPYLYASAEQTAAAKSQNEKDALYLFNCAQRGHGNFLEGHTSFLYLLLAAGLKYPVTSAALGAWWSFSRVLYAIGYTNVDKKNGTGRYIGSGQYISFLGLLGLTIKTGLDMVNA
ncbi:unnamed protein product [Parascedosporium putredinis]|uniref:Membrane-associated proteins in eicosanoid and glutathione metabolism n=1 Tax=Parascedosporium putredinis TaxID=1442378 RepID=A0A9P1H9N7_9PEZI|nr:unnamed protein product [Parascedosporium putredinis]CAI8001050.1 unnamed protein product [Parascedosporium putredinis]